MIKMTKRRHIYPGIHIISLIIRERTDQQGTEHEWGGEDTHKKLQSETGKWIDQRSQKTCGILLK